MAHGTPSTHHPYETWPNIPVNVDAIHLIQFDDSKLRGPNLSTNQEEEGHLVKQKLTSDESVVSSTLLSDSSLHRLDVHSEDNEHYYSEREASRMVHSPESNSEVRASVEGPPQTRQRGVTYDLPGSGSSPHSRQEKLRQERKDSAYYSNIESYQDVYSDEESESEERRKVREKVVLLRRKLLGTRETKRRERTKIRLLRENVRVSLAELTQKINELVALNKVPPGISPLCNAFRTAQDELGPAEYEYEEWEDTLEDEEEELEELEEEYYRVHRYRNNLDAFDQGSRVDDSISSQDSRVNNTTSTVTKPENLSETSNESLESEPDLLQKYLSLVDQALELRVELQNLEDEYVGVSGDANIRKRNGFPLSAVMVSFLADFVESRSEMLDDIHRTEQELFDLREECLKQRIFEPHQYPFAPRDELQDELMEVVEETLQRSPLLVAAQRIKHLEATKNFSSKQDHVNAWLLQCVQKSTVDMMMLRSWIYFSCPGISETPDKTLVQIGDDRWTDYSVFNWFRDAAGMYADVNYNDSRLDVIAGDANKLNKSLDNWSLSTYHSDIVGLEYNAFTDRFLITSEVGSHITHKGDQDANPSKTRSEKRNLPSTVLEVEPTGAISERASNAFPTRQTITSKPEKHDTQDQSAEPRLSIIFCGFQESQPSPDDSRHLPGSDISTATAQHPVLAQSVPIVASIFRAPSVCSVRTTLDTAEPLMTEESPSPLQKSGTMGAPNTSRSFLEIQKATRSRSLSLNEPKRPIHHLARRSFDLSITRTTTEPIRKSSSFAND